MIYPIKIWLFTIFVSPVVWLLLMLVASSGNLQDIITAFPLIFYMVLFGLVLSLPALLLFYFLYKELGKRSIEEWKQKLIFSLVGTILIWITFYIYDSGYFSGIDFSILIWPLSYSIALIAGCVFYDLKSPKNIVKIK